MNYGVPNALLLFAQGGIMTDRELLELAAKAAGIKLHHWWEDEFVPVDPNTNDAGVFWNPLTDDGDALRLAVKLSMTVSPYVVEYGVDGIGKHIIEDTATDPYAATRRAIVRAAAEIGRGL